MLTAPCSKSLWLLVERLYVKAHLSRITASNEPTTSFERDNVTQADFSVLISPWLGQITSGLPTIRPPGRQDTDDNFRVWATMFGQCSNKPLLLVHGSGITVFYVGRGIFLRNLVYCWVVRRFFNRGTV